MHRKVFSITHIVFILVASTTLIIFGLQNVFASPFDLNINDSEALEAYIKKRTEQIEAEPKNPILYIERGDARFLVHEFDQAVDDYTAAININNNLDDAYFGRGLALGRSGFIEDGIEDLGVFIKRNPKSSIAYTKRGVRYIWLGDMSSAKADLEMALKLDPRNAEAHDDIGVIFAKHGQYKEAAEHFMAAFGIDPTYQKAWYNMALVSYITSNDQLAFNYVENALVLSPGDRNALILKAKILESMGRKAEAEVIMDEAAFLPEGNWSERVPIK